MHLPTHALLGWGVANLAPSLDRRGRALVFFASVIPDLDALSLLAGPEAYQAWHRVLCHNVSFASAVTIGAALLARTRCGAVAGLALLNFHVHLLCDYVGAAGPDGSLWGIPYLQPFDDANFTCAGQWGLRSWQNALVTLAGLATALWIARRHARSPVEPFSLRGDAAVVEVVRRRLGESSLRPPPRP